MKILNTIENLGENFFEYCEPSAAKNPSLIHFNSELAKELDLELSDDQILSVFSGKERFVDSKSKALIYAGHQFGHFNPQLGDGRAHLLFEVESKNKEHFDVQLKGSGVTKFSRRGDGLSSIGPVIREYILSESMHRLNIKTSRALCAVRTGDQVYRDDVLPGAIFTRVADSHIRVGTFEYFSSRYLFDDLKELTNYTIERHYPNLINENEKYLKLLDQFAYKTLDLVASWMGIGFIHGVMNTDNTSICGMTIDYGPCAFMDEFKHDQVFSSIDRNGRYAYNNQGQIALWNISVFASAIFPLIKEEYSGNEKELIEFIQIRFKEYENYFEHKHHQIMLKKLGLNFSEKNDYLIVESLLNYMESNKLDFTNTFKNIEQNIFITDDFKNKWMDSLDKQNIHHDDAKEIMSKVNPYYIPRNHQVEKAIQSSIAGDDSYFFRVLNALENPFEYNSENDFLSVLPADNERVRQTFCGT